MESQMSSFVGESYEQFLNGIYEAVNICGRSLDKDEERSLLLERWKRSCC